MEDEDLEVLEDEDLEELEDETLVEILEDDLETELTADDTNTKAEQVHQDFFCPVICCVQYSYFGQ